MKNMFSLMAGGAAGLGAVGAVTLGNATSASEAMAAYMTFVAPSMVLGLATAVTSLHQWENRKEYKGFIEPKRLAASFAVVAGCAAGMAYMGDLPLTPRAQNEIKIPMTGECYGVRISDGQVILPPGCSLKR
jgi:hypothetical protein